MPDLTRYLQQRLDEKIARQRENLAAHAARIEQAETLAGKLHSQGLDARAAARIDGEHVLIWIAVTAVYPDINNALEKLDMVERERFVSPRDCEIYVQGCEVPLYLTQPQRPRNALEQLVDAAVANSTAA